MMYLGIKYIYFQIMDVLNKLSKKDFTITMGDFNVKVVKGSERECIGLFGLG